MLMIRCSILQKNSESQIANCRRMDAAFYDEFYRQADISYGPNTQGFISVILIIAIISLCLHPSLLYVILFGNPSNFRTADKVFMGSMIFAHIILGLYHVVIASFQLALNHFPPSYAVCIISSVFVSFCGSWAVGFAAFMVIEQGWTIVIGGRSWPSWFVGLVFAAICAATVILITGPFWSPELIAYLILSPSGTYCFPDTSDRRIFPRLGTLIIATMAFCVPFYVILVNIFIWMKLKASERALKKSSSNNLTKHAAPSNHADMKRVFVQRAIIFSICNLCGWTLYTVNLGYGFITGTQVSADLDMIAILLYDINVGLANPIILFVFDKRIKEGILQLLGRQEKKSSGSIESRSRQTLASRWIQ